MSRKTPLGQNIRVYRMYQLAVASPCQLGNPCETCQAHERRKKLNTICPLAVYREPAKWLSYREALAWVRDGMATFIYEHTALRMTFSRLAQLRDRSLKIDERFLEALVADHFPEASQEERAAARQARAIVENWDGRAHAALIEAPTDGRILSFAP